MLKGSTATVHAFADSQGVTTSAIYQAIKRGAIDCYNGLVDLHGINTETYIKAAPQREAAKKRGKANRRAGRPPKKAKLPDAPTTPTEEQHDGPTPGTKEYFSVEKLKAQTENIKINMAEKLGELVPREDVKATLGKISSILATQIITMGTRLSGDIAGLFGSNDAEKIHAVKERINEDVTKIIADLKRTVAEEIKNEKNTT